ncbi:MAG: hypothetical protein U0V70_11055 [Terriglobia bacterium]
MLTHTTSALIERRYGSSYNTNNTGTPVFDRRVTSGSFDRNLSALIERRYSTSYSTSYSTNYA